MSNKSVESYKHFYAKKVLAEWLRDAVRSSDEDRWANLWGLSWRPNRKDPFFGVYEEYPVHKDVGWMQDSKSCIYSWDDFHPLVDFLQKCVEEPWYQKVQESIKEITAVPPTYDQLIRWGLGAPVCILDVAVMHKGTLIYGFEVTHMHPVDLKKFQILSNIDAEIFEVSADWILEQVECPKTLKTIGKY